MRNTGVPSGRNMSDDIMELLTAEMGVLKTPSKGTDKTTEIRAGAEGKTTCVSEVRYTYVLRTLTPSTNIYSCSQ